MSNTRRRTITIDQDGREIHVGADAGRVAEGGAGAIHGMQDFVGAMGGAPLTRAQRFARLDALATLLDVAFVVPGTNIRYGIDGLIGLVPVVGDLITTAISLWIVREARALGAPRHVVARMLGNVALDGVVGLVPFVGDAFDVAFRANVRNLRLLKRWMDREAARR
jgi:hypothetical protein